MEEQPNAPQSQQPDEERQQLQPQPQPRSPPPPEVQPVATEDEKKPTVTSAELQVPSSTVAPQTPQPDEEGQPQQQPQPHSPLPPEVQPVATEDEKKPTAPPSEFLVPGSTVAPPPHSSAASAKPAKHKTEPSEEVVVGASETEAPPRPHPKAPSVPATPNPAACYKQPDWSSPCPADAGYNVEVIKNGVPLTDDNVDLCSLPEKEEVTENADAVAVAGGDGLRFCVFGRQPRGAISPADSACAKCVTMLHPSISRVHAILQYGAGPPVPASQIGSSGEEEPTCKGWHLIDMNSTHGTFVNKRRAPPNRYIRLHVGYVIRLGNSTRLLVLQGPETDVEQQTKESWSELVLAHQKHKAEQLLRESKLAQLDQEDSQRQAARAHDGSGKGEGQSSDKRDDECTWGIDVDESQDDGEMAGSMLGLGLEGGSCLSHESSYAEDPKRALKNYFDREGFDPPQYDFVEGRFGQKNCRIELPLDSGTVYAEVPVSGNKRKEAMAACALEACRLLDRLGEFDAKEGADAVKKAHQKAYWEANDYYSSDEDPFLDRTGQLEQRRRKRMRRLGAPNAPTETPTDAEKTARAEADLSSMSVLSELETLGAEILKVEEELNEAERALTAVNENASEMDELEAYMAAIKNGAPTRAARQALKQRLFELRQKEIRLMRQLGIRQPTGFRGAFCSSASSSAAMAVRTALGRKQQLQKDASREGLESLAEQKRGESKLNTLKRLLPSSIKVKIGPSKEAKTEEFRPEFDEDEEEEKEEKDVTVSTNGVKEPEASGDVVSKSTATREESALPSATAPPPSPKPSEYKTTTVEKAPNRTPLKTQSAPQPPPPPKPSKCKATKVEKASDRTQPKTPSPSKPVVEVPVTRSTPLGPQAPPSLPLPPTVPDPAPESPQPMVEVPQVTNAAHLLTSDEYDVTDPNYVLWEPPKGQTGDGITDLNAKYGY